MSDDDTTIEFFFDVGSPYSYLASTQLDEMEKQTGASIEWRPFLLGGVFEATGNSAPALVPAKAQYMIRDLQRWSETYDIPLEMPSDFPINTLLAQRAIIAAGEEDPSNIEALAEVLFRRYWVEDSDVSDGGVVAGAADEIGLDGPGIVARTQDQSVKDILHENSDEAVERGAFGAPTFFVDDEMFWGNDRLDFVRRAVTG